MTDPQTGDAPPTRSDGAGARLASLDVLRFVAVALVFARHVTPELGAWPDGLRQVMSAWRCAGWTGVDLFFVLSGFLVSGLLFREYREHGSVSVGRFLVRRGFKIYPAFYALLAATVVSRTLIGDPKPVPGRELVAEALFFQNYAGGLWWHTWSLAVEEHFYLLCAGLTFLLVRRGRGRADPFASIPAIVALVLAGCLALRIATHFELPYRELTHVFPTHLRLDGLALGVGLSYLHHFHRARMERAVAGRRLPLCLVGMACIAPAFVWDLRESAFMHTAGFTLIDLGAGVLVVALVVNGIPKPPPVRFMAWAGRSSYSIYLWHVPVLFETERVFRSAFGAPAWSPAAIATYMVASIPVGVVTAKLVEMPALRLRDRLFPDAAAPRTGADAPHDEPRASRVSGPRSPGPG